MAAQEVQRTITSNQRRISDVLRIIENLTGNIVVYYVVYRLLELIELILNTLLTKAMT